MRIDLHTHSSVSDGTDTPAELIDAAVAAGLDAVALTDHDTSAGWAEAAAAVTRHARPGLWLVPGAELSCTAPDGRGGRCTVHLLAYLFDPASPALAAEQRRLRQERRVRLRRMAQRMADDGLPVDPAGLLASLPAGSAAGRPHLAMALVRAGVAKDVDEAFARYLRSGGRYYVGRVDTPVCQAIEMISDAGGVTVLAHAFATRRGPTVTAEVIAELAEHGMAGVEVDHPDHDEPTRRRLRGLATDLGLVVTGSSDYHGTNKRVVLGQENTAPAMLEALVARSTGTAIIRG